MMHVWLNSTDENNRFKFKLFFDQGGNLHFDKCENDGSYFSQEPRQYFITIDGKGVPIAEKRTKYLLLQQHHDIDTSYRKLKKSTTILKKTAEEELDREKREGSDVEEEEDLYTYFPHNKEYELQSEESDEDNTGFFGTEHTDSHKEYYSFCSLSDQFNLFKKFDNIK